MSQHKKDKNKLSTTNKKTLIKQKKDKERLIKQNLKEKARAQKKATQSKGETTPIDKSKLIKKNIKEKTNKEKQIIIERKRLIKQNLKEKARAQKTASLAKNKKEKASRIRAMRQAKVINKLNNTPQGEVEVKNSTPDIVIEVKNVSKVYASKMATFEALKGVNITIKKGELIAILGPSGSGKTTLLNMISGLDRPTHGEVVVKNTNLAALKFHELTLFRRNNVGFIFQSYNLLPSLNVKDNIEVGQVLQTDHKKRLDIDTILDTIGMSGTGKKRIYELSGGQQQRVSIARALAKNPSILIGDEPTGALDHLSSDAVLKLFQDINKKFKTTIVLVTHDDDVASVANRVIRVVDGKIASVETQKPRIVRGDYAQTI